MAMSKEHKAALAQGRKESRAIKTYLEAMARRKPGRPVTAGSLQAKIARLDSQLSGGADQLRRVGLLQQRIDAKSQLAALEDATDVTELEREFAANVKSYSQRKGITYAAWREAGVPAAVLKKAGLSRAG
jgi:hypothetical protein